ncbi:hypothetical protein KIN20_003046 [Parelaphostrongylus tenuis]|uniref:Uncharacterized protein n=1 Tax=Parelaphostrongylus tenuis TaxID=148309 RepID=A0AAD5LWQ3_PARTN|nr:hypothetical protein KIN20_003046 [Parelaphostrongylus tenuis]
MSLCRLDVIGGLLVIMGRVYKSEREAPSNDGVRYLILMSVGGQKEGEVAFFKYTCAVVIVLVLNIQWSTLFLGASIFVAISTVPFMLLARSDPALWTRSTSLLTSNTIHIAKLACITAHSRAPVGPSDSSYTEYNPHASVHEMIFASQP